MSQNRKPPAYQEYAATILSNRQFRQLSLASRGLVWSMKLECWENHSVPAPTHQLARTLGFQHNEVLEALTNEVLSFFEENNGVYINPELEDYRSHLNDRKKAQEEGGRRGAALTNASKKSAKAQVTHQGINDSLVKSKTEKQKPVSKENVNIDDIWIGEYDDEESKESKS